MPRRACLMLLVFVVLLSACAPRRLGDPYALVTFLPTRTATLPPATAAPTGTPTLPKPTPVPPTDTPRPTAIPALSDEGPWLLLERVQPWLGSSATHITDYFFANADGTNLQRAALPGLPENRTWTEKSAPGGRFAAFRARVIQGDLMSMQIAGFDDALMIVRLPENKVVSRLPLLGGDAWEQIRAQAESMDLTLEGPLALGLTLDPASFLWSPDGRTLAYSAAVEGTNPEIYLYDTQSGESRRVTDAGVYGAQPWFWSADGLRLIYRTGLSYGADLSEGLGDLTGVYALTLESGQSKKLYNPKGPETVWGITKRGFTTAEVVSDGVMRNLRQVDFTTGMLNYLFYGQFTNAVASPTGVTLMYFETGAPGSEYGLSTGIYRLNPLSFELEPLLYGVFHYLSWENYWKVFLAIRDAPGAAERTPESGAVAGTGQSIAFRIDELGNLVMADPAQLGIRSPNGQWMVTQQADSLMLVPAGGAPVPLNQPGGRISWLPDSSGFYAMHCAASCALALYAQSKGWEPQPLAGTLQEVNDYWVMEGKP